MTTSLTTPVTGSAQTGFTAPTYTLTADVSPDQGNGRQYAVTAIGGTQTGVTVHSVSSPFTINAKRPALLKALQAVTNQLTFLGRVPRNTYVINVRKGVTPFAGQPAQILMLRLTVDVPAGSETADAANVRASLSLLGGALAQNSAAYGDTFVSSII